MQISATNILQEKPSSGEDSGEHFLSDDGRPWIACLLLLFSSCIGSLDEIQSDRFVGRTGKRTLFQIECESGKAIKTHSQYDDIDEVVLLPGIQLQVIDQVHSNDGLCTIRLREINNTFTCLSPSLVHSVISTKRNDKKIFSAPVRTRTNTVSIYRSQSFASLSSPASNTPNIQKKSTEKPTKSYENKVLKQVLQQEQRKETIRLSKQFFNYDDMEMISDELSSNTSWTMMCLWENHLNERHMRLLMNGMHVNSTMVCLSLDRNVLGDDGASVIGAALTKNTSIRSIHLNSNGISDVGAKELSKMLCVNQTLIDLELCDNSIGDDGVGILCDALKVNKSLRTLCLNGNKMSSIGGEYVGEMLEVNRTLIDIRLSSNSIGNDGVMSIVDALERSNNTLESLHIGETMVGAASMYRMREMLRKNKMLKCLCMNKNDVGDDGMMVLCEGLQRNRTLTSLDVSMTGLSKKSAKKLACLLEEGESALSTVNMSDNGIGDERIAAICNALKKNTNMLELVMENVEMSVEGMHELAAMLCWNNSLQSLVLNNNDIDASGIKLLMEGLERSKSVTHLYMNNCNLNDECVPLFIALLERNNTLICVEMVKNRFTTNVKTALKEAVLRKTNCSIYLDFTFH